MQLKTKKIIVREGLILLCFMIISVVLVWIGVPTGYHYQYFTKIGLNNPFPYFDSPISALLYGAGVRIAFIVYPIYLFIRFIIWAIKTLRKSNLET